MRALGHVLSSPKGISDFFMLLNCRVIVTERPDVDSPIKLIFRVPPANYHFVRWFLAQSMRMGILYEVETLGFFECRLEKYQFTYIRFE